MRKRKIGVFGSAFNPPTRGHIDAVEQAMKKFDEVWLFPSFAHPHGKKPIPFNDRIDMLKELIVDLDLKNIVVSDLEKDCFEFMNKEYLYTYDLLKYLSNRFPQNKFTFICGSDNASAEKWQSFYKNEEIDKEFGKFVVKERVSARSTYIRNAIEKKDWNTVKKLTYPTIVKRLKENNYY